MENHEIQQSHRGVHDIALISFNFRIANQTLCWTDDLLVAQSHGLGSRERPRWRSNHQLPIGRTLSKPKGLKHNGVCSAAVLNNEYVTNGTEPEGQMSSSSRSWVGRDPCSTGSGSSSCCPQTLTWAACLYRPLPSSSCACCVSPWHFWSWVSRRWRSSRWLPLCPPPHPPPPHHPLLPPGDQEQQAEHGGGEGNMEEEKEGENNK